MNRRSILNTAGLALTTAIAGCIETLSGNEPSSGSPNDTGGSGNSSTDDGPTGNGGPTDDDISLADAYEQCHLVAIDFEWLPDELKAEVNEAMKGEAYEAERIGLAEAVDPEKSYLVIGDIPHELQVETVGDVMRLTLVEVEYLTAPNPRTITVENTADREHELEITLTGEEPIVDETVTVLPGSQTELTATDRFGTYDLTVRMLTGKQREDHFEYTISDSGFNGFVTVTESDLIVTQDVAEIVPCEWDETAHRETA